MLLLAKMDVPRYVALLWFDFSVWSDFEAQPAVCLPSRHGARPLSHGPVRLKWAGLFGGDGIRVQFAGT